MKKKSEQLLQRNLASNECRKNLGKNVPNHFAASSPRHRPSIVVCVTKRPPPSNSE